MSSSRKTKRLRLSEFLSAEELRILFRIGLEKRFPKLYDGLMRQLNDLHVTCERQFEVNLGAARANASHSSKSLQYAVHEVVVKEVLQLYP